MDTAQINSDVSVGERRRQTNQRGIGKQICNLLNFLVLSYPYKLNELNMMPVLSSDIRAGVLTTCQVKKGHT